MGKETGRRGKEIRRKGEGYEEKGGRSKRGKEKRRAGHKITKTKSETIKTLLERTPRKEENKCLYNIPKFSEV